MLLLKNEKILSLHLYLHSSAPKSWRLFMVLLGKVLLGKAILPYFFLLFIIFKSAITKTFGILNYLPISALRNRSYTPIHFCIRKSSMRLRLQYFGLIWHSVLSKVTFLVWDTILPSYVEVLLIKFNHTWYMPENQNIFAINLLCSGCVVE